jgi:hypothetical protein
MIKRKTLEELKHELPFKFIVSNRTSHEIESEEEEEEEFPPSLSDTELLRSISSTFGKKPSFVNSGITTPNVGFPTLNYSVSSFSTHPHYNSLTTK